jgi:hypothetical protein
MPNTYAHHLQVLKQNPKQWELSNDFFSFTKSSNGSGYYFLEKLGFGWFGCCFTPTETEAY